MNVLPWLKAFKPLALNIPPKEAVRAACGAFLSMSLVMLVCLQFFDQPTTTALMAALAASSVLVFLTPATPLAHPWSLLSGNLLAAAIAITVGIWIDEPALRIGLVLAGSMLCLLSLRCMHPPSCKKKT